MNVDLSVPLKGAIIRHLADDPDLTSVVPGTSIFGIQVPTTVDWPFIRYGVPLANGYEASCWEGTQTDITLHAFAESGPGVSGEDAALTIASKIVAAMSSLAPVGLGIVDNSWTNTNLFKDDQEADRWHAVVTFSITAVKKD